MATAASNQLYPFSNEKGEAIPLDIVRPLGAVVVSVAANAATSFSIPTNYTEVSISSTIDVLIDFDDTATYPAVGPYNSALILRKDVIYTQQLPDVGAVKIIPINTAESGKVFINAIQKWAGIGLNRQLTRR